MEAQQRIAHAAKLLLMDSDLHGFAELDFHSAGEANAVVDHIGVLISARYDVNYSATVTQAPAWIPPRWRVRLTREKGD